MKTDKIFYLDAELTQKSGIPLNGKTEAPVEVFEPLEIDMIELTSRGLTIQDVGWTSAGFNVNLDVVAQQKKEDERKDRHEAAAYKQQDSFFTPNKRHLFDGVVYNAPPADMEQLPKMNSYRVFMKALWTEYHTRIENGSKDYNYSSFVPQQVYSYVELEQEWSDYNNVST
jgi:hypothetical protein